VYISLPLFPSAAQGVARFLCNSYSVPAFLAASVALGRQSVLATCDSAKAGPPLIWFHFVAFTALKPGLELSGGG